MQVVLVGGTLVCYGTRKGVGFTEEHELNWLREIWSNREELESVVAGNNKQHFLSFKSGREQYSISGDVLVALTVNEWNFPEGSG